MNSHDCKAAKLAGHSVYSLIVAGLALSLMSSGSVLAQEPQQQDQTQQQNPPQEQAPAQDQQQTTQPPQSQAVPEQDQAQPASPDRPATPPAVKPKPKYASQDANKPPYANDRQEPSPYSSPAPNADNGGQNGDQGQDEQEAPPPPPSRDRNYRNRPRPSDDYGDRSDAQRPAQPSVPLPSSLTIPAGTILSVRMNEFVSSDKNQVGDRVTATLDRPIVVNGWVVARRGQTLTGQVTAATKAGRVKGTSQLGL